MVEAIVLHNAYPIDAADGGRENRLHAYSVSVLTGFALPTT